MKKYLLLVIALTAALSGMPGCGSRTDSSSSSVSTTAPIPIPKAPLDTGGLVSLPDYVDWKWEPDQEYTVDCTAVRDDLGVELSQAPFTIEAYLEILKNLDLYKAEEGTAADLSLEVEKPFTLKFTYQGKTDVFSFTSKGIKYNGDLCMPNKPEELSALYEIDDQGFLDGDLLYFRDELPKDDSIVKAELQRSHYDDSITLTIQNPDTLAQFMEDCGSMIVRKILEEEEPSYGIGGAFETYTFTGDNGTSFVLENSGGVVALTKDGAEPVQYKILVHPDLEDIYTAYGKIPSLDVQIGTGKAEAYLKSFSYEGNQKQYANEIPIDYLFESHASSPTGGGTAKLTFSQTPKEYTVALTPRENMSLGKETPITVNQDGNIPLPEEKGEYFLLIRAVYDPGQVEYQCGFLVTDMPAFFDSIDYGNEGGDVQVTRDDQNLTVQGTQNRQYVTFIESLDLRAANPEEQEPSEGLSVKYPFTLTFHQESSEPQKFSFQPDSPYVLYNGKPYLPANRVPMDSLYLPYNPDLGEISLNIDVMGFLSEEILPLKERFPIKAEDISTAKVILKRAFRRSVSVDDQGNVTFDQELDILESKDLTSEEFTDLLKEFEQIPTANVTQDIGAFDYGKYHAYELTMKDGTQYELDGSIFVNGEDTGYYFIPIQRE